MKLRILNIADVKGELAPYCASGSTSHYARVQISLRSPRDRNKVARWKRIHRVYTTPPWLRRPSSSVILKFRSRWKEGRRKGPGYSPESSWNQSSANLHFCTLMRLAPATKHLLRATQHGRKNAENNCHFRKISTLAHCCAPSKPSFSLPLSFFISTSRVHSFSPNDSSQTHRRGKLQDSPSLIKLFPIKKFELSRRRRRHFRARVVDGAV